MRRAISTEACAWPAPAPIVTAGGRALTEERILRSVSACQRGPMVEHRLLELRRRACNQRFRLDFILFTPMSDEERERRPCDQERVALVCRIDMGPVALVRNVAGVGSYSRVDNARDDLLPGQERLPCGQIMAQESIEKEIHS